MEALWRVFCFFYIFRVCSTNEALRASIAITNLEWITVLLDFIRSWMFRYLQAFFGSVTVGAIHFLIICLQGTNQNTRNAIFRTKTLRTKKFKDFMKIIYIRRVRKHLIVQKWFKKWTLTNFGVTALFQVHI